MAERKLTIKVDANTAGLSRGMKAASAQVNTFGSSIQQGITRHAAGIRKTGMALAGLGAAFTGMAVVSIKAAADFEKELATVSTMLDESAMHLMPQYEAGLRNMSKEFGESTATLSKGLYDILSASIPPAQALDVLAVSAKAAVAGITDTGVAADAITTIINAYGLAAEDAADVSDWLFAIVKKGKCLTGDTRILLSNGEYRRIDSLKNSVEIVSWDYRNFIPVKAKFVDMGEKQTVDLMTTCGRKIRTTPEHPYLTPEGWKAVEDLKEGDRIAVPSSLPFFGHTKPKDGWPELLGYLIAEGSIQSGSPSLAIGNPKILEKVQDAARRFGIDVRKINQTNPDKCPIYTLAINQKGGHQKNSVIETLKEYNLWGTNSHTKFIPSEVFRWTRDSIARLLRAYFDGDGWLSEKKSTGQFQLGCCSVSRRLIEDVSHLLLRFGINGQIRHHSHNSWIWEAKRYVEIKRFLDFIGINRSSVQDFLQKILQPRGNKKYLTSMMGSPRKKSKFRPYKGLILTDNQLLYSKIKKIRYGDEEHVYDLIVPKLHNFVANDIVAHNTTFNELAGPIGKVATVAHMAGVNMNELGAMVATLTRSGIKTDQAMTAVLGVMRAFLKASDEGAKTAEIFGVTLDTNTLRTEGLRGVMQKLVNAESEQLAQIFPNIRGLIGFSAALGDAEGFAEDLVFMEERLGKTQEALEKQTNTLSFVWGQIKQEFHDVLVVLGKELIPIIKTELVPLIRDVIEHMKVWIERFKGLSPGMKKFLLMLGPLLIALGGLLMILPGLATAIGLLSGPIGWIVLAITGLTAAFVYFYKTNKGFQKFIDESYQRLIKLGKGFYTLGVNIKAWAIWFGKNFVAIWKTAWSAITTIVKNGVENLERLYVWLGDFILGWGLWFAKNYLNFWKNLFGAVQTGLMNFGKNIVAQFGWIWEKIKHPLEKIPRPDWTPLFEDFKAEWAELPKFTELKMKKMADGIQVYWEPMPGWITPTFDAIKKGSKEGAGAIGDLNDKLKDTNKEGKELNKNLKDAAKWLLAVGLSGKKIPLTTITDWAEKYQKKLNDELEKTKLWLVAISSSAKKLPGTTITDWYDKYQKFLNDELEKTNNWLVAIESSTKKLPGTSITDWYERYQTLLNDELEKTNKWLVAIESSVKKLPGTSITDWYGKYQKLLNDELEKTNKWLVAIESSAKKLPGTTITDWYEKYQKLLNDELEKTDKWLVAIKSSASKVPGSTITDWAEKDQKAINDELERTQKLLDAVGTSTAKLPGTTLTDWAEKYQSQLNHELEMSKKYLEGIGLAAGKLPVKTISDWAKYQALANAELSETQETLIAIGLATRDFSKEQLALTNFFNWLGGKLKEEKREWASSWMEYFSDVHDMHFRSAEDFEKWWNERSDSEKRHLDESKADWEGHVADLDAIWQGFTSSVESSMSDMFYDMMMGTTDFKDAWQAFCDSIKQAFVRAIADMIVEKLGLDQLFSGNILEWGNLFTGLGNVITSVFKGVGTAVWGVLTGIGDAIWAAGSAISGAFTAAGTSVAAFAGELAIMWGVWELGTAIIDEINKEWMEFYGTVEDAKIVLENLGELTGDIAVGAKEFLEDIIYYGEKYGETMEASAHMMWDRWGEALEWIFGSAEEFYDAMQQAAEDAGIAWGETTEEMASDYQELYNEAGRLATEGTEQQKEAFAQQVVAHNELTEIEKANIYEVLGITQEAANQMSASMRTAADEMVGSSADASNQVSSNMSLMASNTIQSINMIPKDVLIDIHAELSGLGTVQGALGSIPRDITTYVRTVYEGGGGGGSFQHGGTLEEGELVLSRPITNWIKSALSKSGPMGSTPSVRGGLSNQGRNVVINVPRGAFIVYGDIRTKEDVEELTTNTVQKIADQIAQRVVER